MTDYLTTTEAADRLGCTRHHIALLMRSGRVDGQRFGRYWMVCPDSLARYCAMRGTTRKVGKSG